jgi:hypothetical protein
MKKVHKKVKWPRWDNYAQNSFFYNSFEGDFFYFFRTKELHCFRMSILPNFKLLKSILSHFHFGEIVYPNKAIKLFFCNFYWLIKGWTTDQWKTFLSRSKVESCVPIVVTLFRITSAKIIFLIGYYLLLNRPIAKGNLFPYIIKKTGSCSLMLQPLIFNICSPKNCHLLFFA